MYSTRILIASSILQVVSVMAYAAQPLGSSITYQGHLKQDDRPLDGEADLRFTLFDAETAGNPIGLPVELSSQPVEDGLFQAELDFGATAFDGDARWCSVEVRYPAGVGDYVELTPRSSIAAVPYAMHSLGGYRDNPYSLSAIDGDPIEAVFVDEAGNVGIGTTVPTQLLDVNGTARARGIHIARGGDAKLWFLNGDIGKWSIRNDVSGPDSLGIRNEAGNQILTVTQSRNVGIGTTTPDEKLEVNGNIKTTTGRSLPNLVLDSANSGDGWTDQGAVLFLGESGALGTGAMHLTYVGNGYGYSGAGAVTNGIPGGGYWRYDYNDPKIYTPCTVKMGTVESASGGFRFPDGSVQMTAAGSGGGLWTNESGNAAYGGDIRIGGGASGYDSASEALVIHARSDVWYVGAQNESTASATDFFIGLDNEEDGIFHIQHDGKLGIGTKGPGARLTVKDSDNQVLLTHPTVPNAGGLVFNDFAGTMPNGAITFQRRSPSGAFEAVLLTIDVATGDLDIAGDVSVNGSRVISSSGNWVGGNSGDCNCSPGEDGEDGISCWDLNMNGTPDVLTEDTNGDGFVNVLDCRGEGGGQAGEDGINCWDLDEDHVCDSSEDRDDDGACTAYDCQIAMGVACQDNYGGITDPNPCNFVCGVGNVLIEARGDCTVAAQGDTCSAQSGLCCVCRD